MKFIILFLLFSLVNNLQVFAGVTIPIHGKVLSYNKDVYRIQTYSEIISIKKSKAHPALRRQLKMTGGIVRLRIPASTISNYKKLKVAKPITSEVNNNETRRIKK